ncbi:PB1 domain protein (macronuclear) [Tetrahymena thermophila SB210]|uniref:PB1 domain protein n=1 Tax=Tetrahymena thermophila (strain SB210) TaxID=312017 RepID=I7MFE1_TETTS|nr:PB1 domain protein [Tetrahymena thermophila SB210]EAR83827.2 PB1 domain protein [Tetrahymena thermophila SB210]|eukprot:XP_001031490.2 PB1 domain protein [Tetrahymena thermophila SB210]
MVFIKLQYKDNIKKILITKEEITWQKICEILHQIFKLEDSNQIRLVYKDEEGQSEEIEIKTNEQLLETINKRLIKKFIKFFVFYSGVVENDQDALYTSLIDQKSANSKIQNKRKESVGLKAKKKILTQEETQKDQLTEQKNVIDHSDQPTSSLNSIQKEIQNQQPSLSTDIQMQQKNPQKNALIQVETQEQFKTILSKAINKSQVFEEIKGIIRDFINDPLSKGQTANDRLYELKQNESELMEQEYDAKEQQQKTEEEIEYSIQTNLQQISDLVVQNIKEVIDEQLTKQLDLPENYRRPFRKYSEDLFEKKKNTIKNNLTQIVNKELSSPLSPKSLLKKKLGGDDSQKNLDRINSAKTLPDDISEMQEKNISINYRAIKQADSNSNYNSNTSSQSNNLNNTSIQNNLSESIYNTTEGFQSRYLKRKNTNSERILEIIQEQEQTISNIENTLLKTQKISEQQINQQFEQNFRSIHHLFQSINQQNAQKYQTQGAIEIDNNQDSKIVQNSFNRSTKNKTISAYELYLLLDKQVQQYCLPDQYKDDDSDSSTLQGFDSLINEQIILKSKHQRVKSKFIDLIEEEKKEEDIVSNNQFQDNGLESIKTQQNNQKQVFEDTIVQLVSPLKSFKQSQQNDAKSMLQLIKANHFELNENNTENKIDSVVSPKYSNDNNIKSINNSSQEIINEVEDDSDLESNLPKIIMTKKISCSLIQNA